MKNLADSETKENWPLTLFKCWLALNFMLMPFGAEFDASWRSLSTGDLFFPGYRLGYIIVEKILDERLP